MGLIEKKIDAFSVVDICLVSSFFVAFAVNKMNICSEGFAFVLLMATFVLSAVSVSVFLIYSAAVVLRKHAKKTKLFIATHAVNIVWAVSVTAFAASIKLMGASLF